LRIFGRNAVAIGSKLVSGGFAKDFAEASYKFFGATPAYLSVQKGGLDELCGRDVVATLRERVAEVAKCSPAPAAAVAQNIAAFIDDAAKVAAFYH
jgi:hypothetical protein